MLYRGLLLVLAVGVVELRKRRIGQTVVEKSKI
jgi:hypothetical protein